MFEWLKKLRQSSARPILVAREPRSGGRNTSAVNLRPYTPEPREYLGQLGYLHLSYFEILTNELKYSPNTQYKAELSEAAAHAFEKFRFISRKLAEAGFDATDAMDPYSERIQTFHSNTSGIDWYEAILKVYLVSGLLDDFYRRLAVGLKPAIRVEIDEALDDPGFEEFAVKVLLESMEADPTLGSRLAVWGRRLMGDALLELRAAFDNRKLAGVADSAKLSMDQEREVNLAAYSKLEPLVTELIGTHTLRMDALGLTA